MSLINRFPFQSFLFPFPGQIGVAEEYKLKTIKQVSNPLPLLFTRPFLFRVIRWSEMGNAD